jgi:hypothetical protein
MNADVLNNGENGKWADASGEIAKLHTRIENEGINIKGGKLNEENTDKIKRIFRSLSQNELILIAKSFRQDFANIASRIMDEREREVGGGGAEERKKRKRKRKGNRKSRRNKNRSRRNTRKYRR